MPRCPVRRIVDAMFGYCESELRDLGTKRKIARWRVTGVRVTASQSAVGPKQPSAVDSAFVVPAYIHHKLARETPSIFPAPPRPFLCTSVPCAHPISAPKTTLTFDEHRLPPRGENDRVVFWPPRRVRAEGLNCSHGERCYIPFSGVGRGAFAGHEAGGGSLGWR